LNLFRQISKQLTEPLGRMRSHREGLSKGFVVFFACSERASSAS
jgi:hypothetical protein